MLAFHARRRTKKSGIDIAREQNRTESLHTELANPGQGKRMLPEKDWRAFVNRILHSVAGYPRLYYMQRLLILGWGGALHCLTSRKPTCLAVALVIRIRTKLEANTLYSQALRRDQHSSQL